jgi:hypothetical protein
MNKDQTQIVLNIVDRFQEKAAKLTQELKAEMLQAGLNSSNPDMLEVAAAQELVLAASKQMAISVQKALLHSEDSKNPKEIISAVSTITEMAEHIMRTSVIDELEKGGIDIESAENYLMEKLKQAYMAAKKTDPEPKLPNEYNFTVKKPDDEDPTVH